MVGVRVVESCLDLVILISREMMTLRRRMEVVSITPRATGRWVDQSCEAELLNS